MNNDTEILIVESNSIQAEQLRQLLQKQHFKVIVAGNGQQALTAARQHMPSVIISSAMLPVMDGYEMCHAMKHDEALKEIPVILLSSFSDGQEIVRGLQAGVDEYLTKPYDQESLRSKLESLLAGSGQQNIRSTEEGLEITWQDKRHLIASDHQHILRLLLSVYGIAVQKSQELNRSQLKLRLLSEQLGGRADERMRKLESSEANYRALLELTSDGIIIVDREKSIRFFNPATEAIFGSQTEEQIQKLLELPLLAGESREVNMIGGDGQEYKLEMRATKTRWKEVPGYLIVLREVTPPQQVEEHDLVANVSHELRTPLSSIKGFVELLLKGMVKDPRVQREFLTRMAQDVDRLTTLVNDLLDISRMESGRFKLNLQEVEVSALVAETLESLEHLAAEKGISIEYTSAKDALLVQADHHRLQQVLINLVGNAIKFSDENKPILVTGETANNHVTIKVIDQGPGIVTEAQPKLFDKFYRAASSGKRTTEGTGLGLYISRQIIEAHGGNICVESEVGKGSTFFFTLPLSQQ